MQVRTALSVLLSFVVLCAAVLVPIEAWAG